MHASVEVEGLTLVEPRVLVATQRRRPVKRHRQFGISSVGLGAAAEVDGLRGRSLAAWASDHGFAPWLAEV
jgi:hypothetical protein